MIKTTDSRNIIWDVFRGTGAIMVLFHHYTNRYDTLFGHKETWPISLPFSLGAWGVCVFFVLTGFFLIPSLDSSPSLGAYYKKRVVRLYSSYIPCVIITWLLMTFTPPLGNRNVSFISFLGNLTMFQHFLGLPNVDGAYWTLAVQLIVYITIGAIFFIVKKSINKLLIVMFVWMIVGSGVSFLHNQLGFTRLTFITDAKFIQLFIQGLLLYCIGTSLYKSIWIYVFLALCVFYDLFWFSKSYFVFNTLLIVIMLVVQLTNVSLKKKGVLVFIGSISYPLYLLHQNIGYLIIRFMEQHGLTSEWWIVIPVSIVITLAWLITAFVEKPISIGINRILSNNK